MKLLFTIFLLGIIHPNCFCQKTVREVVWNSFGSYQKITANFSVDENNVKVLDLIHVYGHDSRFSINISSGVSMFIGNPKDCYDWLKKLVEIIENEEHGTSFQIGKQTVLVNVQTGQKLLYIYEFDGGNGYNFITRKRLKNALESFEKWISVNKDLKIKTATEVDSVVVQKPTILVKPKPDLIADEILKLKNLMDQGVLTKEEFEAQKKKLLGN
jgi:hypothetical protein